ncbi:MAG: prenyltransferase/squalene oxidase repeat-containing protein [Kiritimatiellia bacterium]
MISPYSLELVEAAGYVREWVDEESLRKVADFLRGQLTPEGGFANRAGRSDLYYTMFGIDGLRTLGEPLEFPSLRSYIENFGSGEGLDLVDLACLVRCRSALFGLNPNHPHTRTSVKTLSSYISVDGGFAMRKGAAHGSAYANFLACLAYESVGLTVPNPHRVARSLATLQTEDGGYCNEPGLAEATVPATAAACVTLIRLGQAVDRATIEWLLSRCESDGGFRATSDAPWPDLLSTATALYALKLTAVDLAQLREPCLDFVESLWDESGGFVGHEDDSLCDCEMTFYGLLALGCLESA